MHTYAEVARGSLVLINGAASHSRSAAPSCVLTTPDQLSWSAYSSRTRANQRQLTLRRAAAGGRSIHKPNVQRAECIRGAREIGRAHV